MQKLKAIAVNTFRETVRDKILYNLVFFALLLIALSYLLRTLDILQEAKIIVDISLASISLFGVFIAIFVGVGLVYKEINRRTIFAIVAKPISRPQFLVAKYLGLILTILVNVSVMTAGMYLVLLFTERGLDLSLLKAVLLTCVELMVVTAIALFFSTFTTSTLSAIFTLAVFIIGSLSQELRLLAEKTGSEALRLLLELLYYGLPNLGNFNLRAEAVHHVPVPVHSLVAPLAYGATYVLLTLGLSCLIFWRRDFK